MFGAICFIWIGIKLNAPFWYYIVLGIGVGMGFVDSVKQVSLNRKMKDHIDREAVFRKNIKEDYRKDI